MSANELYQRLVLEHSRAPRHFGELAAPTHAADGINPSCGDSLHVDLRVVDGRIAAIAFRGDACAIAKATASMLGEAAMQLDADGAARLEARFARVIAGELAGDGTLGDLNALAALAHYPSRRKCATLPFAALRAAFAGAARTTTEGDHR
ncbi:MAG: SUF system NifU family Fe-S cluster assembly protein [Proteobacteria bacterium]|uniref:Fe-S cluster assembly sulfur transfer protein SufU n=1 Tax=Rudaea sp. TaxID=2136325 RepID=UPI001D4D5F67|nr:SUF system NifU family Fe-S cluster assembly protein [Pseudomonadota bacterium]MBS0566379.1 SUF system NifU family Fe-S cluster assembly protein [Pseudomonadota bacterium]